MAGFLWETKRRKEKETKKTTGSARLLNGFYKGVHKRIAFLQTMTWLDFEITLLKNNDIKSNMKLGSHQATELIKIHFTVILGLASGQLTKKVIIEILLISGLLLVSSPRGDTLKLHHHWNNILVSTLIATSDDDNFGRLVEAFTTPCGMKR